MGFIIDSNPNLSNKFIPGTDIKVLGVKNGLKKDTSDRIAVINHGKILLVDKKDKLISQMSRKTLSIFTKLKIDKLPSTLRKFNLRLSKEKNCIEYDYKPTGKRTGITSLLSIIKKSGIELIDVQTNQSTLEQIFVEILKND